MGAPDPRWTPFHNIAGRPVIRMDGLGRRVAARSVSKCATYDQLVWLADCGPEWMRARCRESIAIRNRIAAQSLVEAA